MATPIGQFHTTVPAGVNIQIFNTSPVYESESESERCVNDSYMTVPTYPSNYYTQDYANNGVTISDKNRSLEDRSAKNISNEENQKREIIIKEEKAEEKNKPEKIKIDIEAPKKHLKLTDEYIRKLESYLDSKDVEKRIMAAKDILERVQEDETRKDNVALTALTNKMLKDPYQPIRFFALGMLEERLITGNAETIDILKKVETGRYSQNGNTDQDAIKASGVLLKMTRKVQG